MIASVVVDWPPIYIVPVTVVLVLGLVNEAGKPTPVSGLAVVDRLTCVQPSNCVRVAPVTIGKGGTVGEGSVITEDTPAGALSIARGKQAAIANWQRPKKTPK